MSSTGWISLIGAFGSIATAVGVIIATVGVFGTREQIRLSREQARTQFEDDLVREYRELSRELPVEALLGEDLSNEKYRSALLTFYHYIDLSNEQIFLRQQGRVSAETWENWREGIKSNLSRPAFKRAWSEIGDRTHDIFDELRRLEKGGYEEDPFRWKDSY